ncbi:response regulator [Thiorhodovibrio frisius]|uniref:Sensory/regulatory protein RpfC n=1 Tax=Thiorhodovibrio frisius TaxID=631362 RepID=H8Z2M3_9GAMM|nr:response regulator [Thiorhodovibrio frisius]EIC22716.1 PAS domain S-box [Thiorhodovibrio frisius]WPL22473.1 Signal transduction histidine-protein kinase BarA [Thiorhodovibrio frisius]
MMIKRANRIVIAGYLMMIGANLAGFYYYDLTRQQVILAAQHRTAMIDQAEQLLAGTKYLTASVRAYAATGEEIYHDDYWNEVRVAQRRHKAEAALRQLGMNLEETKLIESAKDTSDQLIKLEDEAMILAREGKHQAAIDLVYGKLYLNAIEHIDASLERFRILIDERLGRITTTMDERLVFAERLNLALMVINALMMLSIIEWFYHHRVVGPLIAMSRRMQDLLAGKSVAELPFAGRHSEIGELAQGVEAYRLMSDQVRAEHWVDGQQARIGALLQAAPSFTALAQVLMAEVSPPLQVAAGVFYIYEPDERHFRLLAHYACRERKTLNQSFALGEGLIGQCALEKSPIIITEPPRDYFVVSSALGSTAPSVLMVLPVMRDHQVLAVLELAAFRRFSDVEQTLLDSLMPTLAMCMEILARRLKTDRLLHATQQQAQALEEQAAELAAKQQALLDQASFQEALIGTIPYPVFYKSPDTRLLGVNRAYEKTFGVDRHELIGKRVLDFEFLPEEHRRRYQRENQDAIDNACEIRREISMRLADGREHDMLYFIAGFRRADGSPGGLVGTFVDISEQKTAERTILHAKEVAEQTAKTESAFLANMSHEIRTPMNAVLGMAHLALMTELSPRQQDYIRKIQQAGQHLLGIINNIMVFSKIEAGKLVVEHTNFDLHKVLDNVATIIAEKAAAKGLEFIFRIAPDVPLHLLGDPLRIGQVLVNYCSNSVKLTDAGEVEIEVTLLERAEGTALLRFAVRDTGIGLTQAQMGKLFHSFQQADTSTSRKYGGTGLGLVISKNLAKLMGGEVGVKSEFGQGATFWFSARVGLPQRDSPARSPPIDLRGRHLLVVDDNNSARQALTEMLNNMGFVVGDCASGTAALATLRRAAAEHTPYEAVLLDAQMPDLDGLDTAVAIRQLGLEPCPHLLLLSTYGRDEAMRDAGAAGFFNVLIKPVNPSLLLDNLMRAFGLDNAPLGVAPFPQACGLDLTAIAGARILLVEDNDLNQQVAMELMQGAGLVVDLAENGQEAVAKVQEQSYDAVLMDMQMPVMDGIAATQAIRRLPQCADLPILAMTANVLAQDRERSAAAGMNAHIAKPIDPDNLWCTLIEWIKPRAERPHPLAEAQPDTASALSAPKTPSASASPRSTPLPSQIPGLDTTLGLKRMDAKPDLYQSILGSFAAGQKQAPTRIAALLATGDLATAERLAHTLKGNAANIGATALQQAAEILEAALREPQPAPALQALLATTKEHLDPLIKALEDWLAANAKAANTLPEVDTAGSAASADSSTAPIPAPLLQTLRNLSRLLAEDDRDAIDCWRRNATVLKPLLGPTWPSIERELQRYEFDAAREALHLWANRRELDL